jgi:signal transduction protein with GAF and PtsI domain
MCARLERLLASKQGADDKIEAAVNALCRIYGVERNEVAIFRVDTRLDCFSFLWPPEMRKSGSIPFSANRSLVSTTAGEKRGLMDNSFSTTPHLFVFESYGKERSAIQKIMSVPMLKGEELMGVIQVCRKGEDLDMTLRNFTQPELDALEELAKVVAHHIE